MREGLKGVVSMEVGVLETIWDTSLPVAGPMLLPSMAWPVARVRVEMWGGVPRSGRPVSGRPARITT